MRRKIFFTDFDFVLSPCKEVHVIYTSPNTGKKWIANSLHFVHFVNVVRFANGEPKVKDMQVLKRYVKEYAWQVVSKGFSFDF